MNKIEKLPKEFYYQGDLYTLAMWVTAWRHLCIGYRKALDRSGGSLFSVCVEPSNEPRSIEDTIGYINEYIGNAKTVDDACDELMKWINVNRHKYKDTHS